MRFQLYYNHLSNLERGEFFQRAGTTRQMFWKWRRSVRMPKEESMEKLAAATEGNCTFFEVQQFFRDLADAKYLAKNLDKSEVKEAIDRADVNRHASYKMSDRGEMALALIEKFKAEAEAQQ